MIGTARLRQIQAIDYRNRRALVEAGLVNLHLTRAVQGRGLCFAPDPSSQGACTIGGNIANNSGGPHTLKYGVTVNHLHALEMVLPDGTTTWLGGTAQDDPGLDLAGVTVGSEGTFGMATRAVVRLVPEPRAYRTFLVVFDSVETATACVSAIIAAGILPGAIELMDRLIVQAVEQAFHFGFPLDAAAVLIIELDGIPAGLDAEAARVLEIAQRSGARSVRTAEDGKERARLWAARKRAFGAVGRLAPSYCTQDGVVPRTRLPEVLGEIAEIGERHKIAIANVFHAGDGNLHPLLLFDERDLDQVARVLAASREILALCVRVGGSITGEHGVGIEKIDEMRLMFTDADIDQMTALRSAFNPEGRCNPGKLLPTEKSCVEIVRPRPGAPA